MLLAPFPFLRCCFELFLLDEFFFDLELELEDLFFTLLSFGSFFFMQIEFIMIGFFENDLLSSDLMKG